MNNRPKVGVAVVVVKDGKVLVGKRKGSHGTGEWACPGGHLEMVESPEAGAVRELLEETGLKALSYRLGTWTNDIFAEDKHYITLWVYIDEFEGEVQLMEPHKCDEWRWLSWDELPSDLFLSMRNFIQKVGIENLKKETTSLPNNPLSRFAAYLSS